MTTPPRWDGALLRGTVHGPLPALLLLMTTVTGLVDAVSVLGLGRVFVANMTGNVVFLGFAVAGAPGFALAASLAALAGFLAGALGGGAVVARRGHRRGHLLRDTAVVEVVLMLAAGRPVVTRRVLAVATMFLGALVGALLVGHTRLAWALLPAPVLLAVVPVVLQLALRRPAPWQDASG